VASANSVGRASGTRLEFGLRDLFVVFLKAGFAFGGGVAILSVLEDELVGRRKLLEKSEFYAVYAVGRVTPSGTMTALAVAYGHRFHGVLGGLVALTGLLLPALTITIGAAFAYVSLGQGALIAAIGAVLAPAAIALVAAAALKLGRDVLHQRAALVIALAGFALALFAQMNPALVLLAGGAAGALSLSPTRPTE
jgi:chromate transporter